jgi:hypothetical protein
MNSLWPAIVSGLSAVVFYGVGVVLIDVIERQRIRSRRAELRRRLLR